MEDPEKLDIDSLHRKRLNSWIGWSSGDELPFVFTHWTRYGTLRGEPRFMAGALYCVLTLNDREIETFAGPRYMAHALAAGELDGKLGFSAADAGVPAELWLWNRSEDAW